ncbi:MAG: CPBP family intramembrane metalloprotease [Clostridia bacterium]|nr:CPBP family intramembrane metalloprotease [Clostridia bacterium]
MKKQDEKKARLSLLDRLLGKPEISKTAGISYTVAVLLPAVLSFALIVVLSAFGLTGTEGTIAVGNKNADWYLYVSYLLPQLAFALVAAFALRYQGQSPLEELKNQKCKPKYFIWAVVLQIGLIGLAQLNTLFLEFLSRFGYETSGVEIPSMNGIRFLFVLIVIGVLPAVFEETMFRGLLLNGLHSFGTVGAVLICGGLFSLYHQNPAQTIYQFCCGAAYALLAIRAGSIFPTVLAHFCNNAFILVLTKFQVTELTLPIMIAVFSVSGVCLTVSLIYLIFMDKSATEQNKTPTDEKEKKTQRKNFFVFAGAGVLICALTWFSVLFMGM